MKKAIKNGNLETDSPAADSGTAKIRNSAIENNDVILNNSPTRAVPDAFLPEAT